MGFFFFDYYARSGAMGESIRTFESDENSETIMYDPEKYVNFYGKDTLSLDSPCCDRYNYHFLREK